MTIVVPITAIQVSKPGFRPGPPSSLAFLSVPLVVDVVLATLVGAAVLYRRNPEAHKRLMVLATICLLPAAAARLPFAFIGQYGALAFFGLADLMLIPCVLYDVTRFKRLHPAYIWGGVALARRLRRRHHGRTSATMSIRTLVRGEYTTTEPSM